MNKKCGVGEVTVPPGTMGAMGGGYLPCTVVDNDRSKTRHCGKGREGKGEGREER